MIVSQHFNVRQPWWRPWSYLTVWRLGFRLRVGWFVVELDVSPPPPGRWRSWNAIERGLTAMDQERAV